MDNPDWVQGWISTDVVPGQGMLYGLGTHSLDQTLLLFGKPASVTAFTRVLRLKGGRADDSFTVVLQYGEERKDLICTVKTTIVSTLPMEKQLKFMVRGREGTFLKVSDNLRFVAKAYTDNLTDWRRPTNRPALCWCQSGRFFLRCRAGKIPRRALHQTAIRRFAEPGRQTLEW